MTNQTLETDNCIVLKSSFWYMISNFIVKGLGFISTIAFVRMMSIADYGYYNNYVSWLSLSTGVVTLSLQASLVSGRFEFSHDLDRFTTSILLLSSISTLLFYIIVLFNINMFMEWMTMPAKYIHIMFIYMGTSCGITVFQLIQRYKYRYKLSVLLSVGSSVVSLALSILLVFFLKDKFFARVIGAQIPLIIINIGIYTYYIFKGRGVLITYWKYALKICVPYVFGSISSNVLLSSDRAMITKMCGSESTALYSLPYNIAAIMTVIWDSMNSAYGPWMGEKFYAKKYQEIKKIARKYVGIYYLLLLGAMLLAPECLYIIGGSGYIESKQVIPPVMLGCLFILINGLYINIEQLSKKTVGMALASISAAALNLLLNYIFIPQYGYAAAAYTTAISYLFLFFMHYTMVARIGFTNVYDTKYNMSLIAVSISATFLINYSYSNFELRMILLFIYVFCVLYTVYKNRNFILDFVRRRPQKDI